MSVNPNHGIDNGLSRKKTGLFCQMTETTLFNIARVLLGVLWILPENKMTFFLRLPQEPWNFPNSRNP